MECQTADGLENIAGRGVQSMVDGQSVWIGSLKLFQDAGKTALVAQVEGGALLWNIGALAAGEIREVRFTLQVDGTLPDWLTCIVNVADITFSGGHISAQAVTLLPEKHAVTMMDDPLPTPTAIPAVATDTAPAAGHRRAV